MITTSTQNAIPNLGQGATSSLSITFGSDPNQYNGVWIDFDHSGSFETSEFFTSGTNAGPNGTVVVNIAVPSNAAFGHTRMRIRGGDDNQPNSAQACGASGSSYGQTQDYLVNIAGPSSLSGYVYNYNGTPVSGATVEMVGGLTTTSDGSGHYVLGPLASGSQQFKCFKTGYNKVDVTIDIPDITAVIHDFTLLNPEMEVYPPSLVAILSPTGTETDNLVISNAGNGLLDWTAEVQFLDQNLISGPKYSPVSYCTASGGCDEFISNVTFGSINNTSICTNYGDYTSLSTTIETGKSYSISVTVGPPVYSGDEVGAWIDYNQNGIFDDGMINFTDPDRLMYGMEISLFLKIFGCFDQDQNSFGLRIFAGAMRSSHLRRSRRL